LVWTLYWIFGSGIYGHGTTQKGMHYARGKRIRRRLLELTLKILHRVLVSGARRDDGKRFVLRADEKLTAFVGLEAAIRARNSNCLDKVASF
jgi:hypothetical protein